MFCFFFFNVTASTGNSTSQHTLSLHDALPISWTWNLDVCYGTVSAVLGYRHLTYLTHVDFDGLITPLPGLDVYRDFSGESKSAELRYVSPEGEPVDFVVGLYYQADKWRQLNTVYANPAATTLAQ